VHSRYDRRLDNAAVAGQRVEISLQVRRFFCEAKRAGCGPSPSLRVEKVGVLVVVGNDLVVGAVFGDGTWLSR